MLLLNVFAMISMLSLTDQFVSLVLYPVKLVLILALIVSHALIPYKIIQLINAYVLTDILKIALIIVLYVSHLVSIVSH